MLRVKGMERGLVVVVAHRLLKMKMEQVLKFTATRTKIRRDIVVIIVATIVLLDEIVVNRMMMMTTMMMVITA